MSNNVNVVLDSASIQVIDQVNNVYRVNSPAGSITLAANSANYQSYGLIAAGPGGTPLAFPEFPNPVWVAYVKNLDAAAKITVRFQSQGGSLISATDAPVLSPGGVFIYWNTAETGHGIVAMTLISSVGNTYVEFLLAI